MPKPAYAGIGIAIIAMLLGPPLWAKIGLAAAAVCLLAAAVALKRRLLQAGLTLRIAMDVPLVEPDNADEPDDAETLSSGMATITGESSSSAVDADDRPAVPHWSDVAFPDPDVELGHKKPAETD